MDKRRLRLRALLVEDVAVALVPMELADNISSDQIEKAVHRGLFRIAEIRERLQFSAPAKTLRLVQARAFSEALLWAARSLERISHFPSERDELCESLSELVKLRTRVADSINLATERGLSNVFLGRAIEGRLKIVASTLGRVAGAWQHELNGRFPELFLGIDEMIGSIRADTLPNMASGTLELASQAIAKSSGAGTPTQRDVEDWARRLAEDILSKND